MPASPDSPHPRRTALLFLVGGFFLAVLLLLAGRWIQLDADPLHVLPHHVPEIQARKIYQREFLAQDDLVIAIRAHEDASALELAKNLASSLSKKFPELEERIQVLYPWEYPDAAEGLGQLAAMSWLQAPEELATLAEALASSDSVELLLQESMETLASTFSPGPEEALLALDPLQLSRRMEFPMTPQAFTEGISLGTDSIRALFLDFPGNRNDAFNTQQWLSKIDEHLQQWKEDNPREFSELITTGYAPYALELKTAMKKELTLSAALTTTLVGILFLLVYRRILPFLGVILTLSLTALGTLLVASLIYGPLNSISIGFAAILIALVVDYTIMVQHERSQTDQAHTMVKPILWAATTTALVFLGLNLSSIPGISQLGTLVGLGLAIGATLSLTYFRSLTRSMKLPLPRSAPRISLPPKWALIGALALLISCGGILHKQGLPPIDNNPDNMLPRHMESVSTYQNLEAELRSESGAPMTLLIHSSSAQEIDKAFEALDSFIRSSSTPSPQVISGHAWWPQKNSPQTLQKFNTLALSAQNTALPALEESFTEDALAFLQGAIHYWEQCAEQSIPPPPSSLAAQKILHRLIRPEIPAAKVILAHEDGTWNPQDIRQLQSFADQSPNITLLGWDQLGPVLQRLYQQDLIKVLLPMVSILLLLLVLVFRSWQGILLTIASLCMSALVLLSLMNLFHIRWNQINLMAIPLILGAGLDYNIHLQWALRSGQRSLHALSRTLGTAIVVCGLSTAGGFASLAGSLHPGLASLGQTCALGIFSTFAVTLILLPGWWKAIHPPKAPITPPDQTP